MFYTIKKANITAQLVTLYTGAVCV